MARGQKTSDTTRNQIINDWLASKKTVTDFCKDYHYRNEGDNSNSKLGAATLLNWLESGGYSLTRDNTSLDELKLKYIKCLEERTNSLKLTNPDEYISIL